jgi:hypothetical protein
MVKTKLRRLAAAGDRDMTKQLERLINEKYDKLLEYYKQSGITPPWEGEVVGAEIVKGGV